MALFKQLVQESAVKVDWRVELHEASNKSIRMGWTGWQGHYWVRFRRESLAPREAMHHLHSHTRDWL